MKARKPRQKTPRKLTKIDGKIDIRDWHIDVVEEVARQFESRLMEAVGQALDLAMEDGMATAILGAIHNDDCDPLDVHLRFDFTHGAEGPTLIFDIEQALLDDLEMHVDDMEIRADDGSYSTGLRRIMLKMRELADKIEAAIPPEK